MEKNSKHQFYMQKCRELAEKAKLQGEYPVGSILVKDGQIVAEGIESGKSKRDITCHAEIEAIRDLRRKLDITDLSDYTMYTTHEPCIMCSYVIRHHQISTVVWAISSHEIGGFNSRFNLLMSEVMTKWSKAPCLLIEEHDGTYKIL